MSSLMIIQENNRLIFASDTAHCEGNKEGIYRCYGEKVKKVHSAGKDMAFIPGMTECTNQTERDLIRFVDKKGHINNELLRQYLNRNFPKEKCKWRDLGLQDIGVTTLSVINGQSIVTNFDQNRNYEPVIHYGKVGNCMLWVDGFDNTRIHKHAMDTLRAILKNEYSSPETFIKVYQKTYSEAVGGFIQVYLMDDKGCSMVREQELIERNLKYVFRNAEAESIQLQYSAHIIAASMTGGSIDGTVITSNGSQEAGSNTTKIEEGKISTSYINVSQQSGTDRVGITPGNVLVKNANGQADISPTLITVNQINCGNINGGTPITTDNKSSQMNILYASLIPQVVSAGANFRPHSTPGDNNISCGSPSYRWTQVYAATSTISTSDRALKEQEALITEKEKKVALKIKQLLKTFKYKDAVSEKGYNARIHTGVIAQDVKEAFESENLDPYDYALFCSDTWYEKDGRACNDEESPYTVTDEGVKEVIRLGIRYEELLCFIIAAL